MSLEVQTSVNTGLYAAAHARLGACAHMDLCHGACLRQPPRQPIRDGPRRKAIKRYPT